MVNSVTLWRQVAKWSISGTKRFQSLLLILWDKTDRMRELSDFLLATQVFMIRELDTIEAKSAMKGQTIVGKIVGKFSLKCVCPKKNLNGKRFVKKKKDLFKKFHQWSMILSCWSVLNLYRKSLSERSIMKSRSSNYYLNSTLGLPWRSVGRLQYWWSQRR